LRAGQRAIARSAMAEALAQLRNGLDLLAGLPEADRPRRELDLQVALGVALMATQGWAAPEAGRANARARERCEQIGATAQLWPGEVAAARTHLERTLALYDPERHHSLAFLYVQDPRVAALSALSWTLFALGYPEQARARSREALDAARELAHPNTLAYGLLFA